MGLVTDGCVKLGDDRAACSDCDDIGGTADNGGAFDVGGDTTVVAGADGGGGGGATAAAAAVAYRIGGSVATGRGVGKPAFTMLDMGCWAKFGFGGGGFATGKIQMMKV